jgi:hypothetical protein
MGHWKAVGEGSGVWVGEYAFGKSPMNSFAVDLGDGRLMVISPGTDMADTVLDELDELGTVEALVSPGAFHNMGLARWKERYPKARLFATTSGIAHIAKQHPALPAMEPLSALREIAGDDIHLYECPTKKHEDLLLFVTRGGHSVLCTNEVLANMVELPSNLIFKLLFKLTKSGPGLGFNNLVLKFIKVNRKAYAIFAQELIAKHSVTHFAPCHGAVLRGADTSDRINAVLAAAV